MGNGTIEDGWHLIEPSWSLKGRGLVGVELEKGGARVHHLDLARTILRGGGGAH